ncbi:MAG TPA: hypothetical protein VM364_18530 [Vicinamibacterales bacterium]|nr:hypothetical protein [Vicinamibacterales bacterium]
MEERSGLGSRPAPIVLLVDPHSDTAELYDWALHAAGFTVHRARPGRPPAGDVVPDLAIACMRAPDGALIRTLLGGRRVPTILLTGWIPDGATAADFDCDTLMMIPVTPTVLVETARALLQATS